MHIFQKLTTSNYRFIIDYVELSFQNYRLPPSHRTFIRYAGFSALVCVAATPIGLGLCASFRDLRFTIYNFTSMYAHHVH